MTRPAAVPADTLLRQLAVLVEHGHTYAAALPLLTTDTGSADQARQAAAVLAGRGTLAEALTATGLTDPVTAAAVGDIEPYLPGRPALLAVLADVVVGRTRTRQLAVLAATAWTATLLVTATAASLLSACTAAGVLPRVVAAAVASAVTAGAAFAHRRLLTAAATTTDHAGWAALVAALAGCGAGLAQARASADHVYGRLPAVHALRTPPAGAAASLTPVLAAAAATGLPGPVLAGWATQTGRTAEHQRQLAAAALTPLLLAAAGLGGAVAAVLAALTR